MDGGGVYGDEIDCPHHYYTYDAHTGDNRYPKRVFPRARAEQVKPIRTFLPRARGRGLDLGAGRAAVTGSAASRPD